MVLGVQDHNIFSFKIMGTFDTLFFSFFYQIGSIYEVDILLTNYTYVPLHVNVTQLRTVPKFSSAIQRGCQGQFEVQMTITEMDNLCITTGNSGLISCSRHRTTKFPNSESPIFTMKLCLSYFLLDQTQDQQSAAPSITLSKRASKKCISQIKSIKK